MQYTLIQLRSCLLSNVSNNWSSEASEIIKHSFYRQPNKIGLNKSKNLIIIWWYFSAQTLSFHCLRDFSHQLHLAIDTEVATFIKNKNIPTNLLNCYWSQRTSSNCRSSRHRWWIHDLTWNVADIKTRILKVDNEILDWENGKTFSACSNRRRQIPSNFVVTLVNPAAEITVVDIAKWNNSM